MGTKRMLALLLRWKRRLKLERLHYYLENAVRHAFRSVPSQMLQLCV